MSRAIPVVRIACKASELDLELRRRAWLIWLRGLCARDSLTRREIAALSELRVAVTYRLRPLASSVDVLRRFVDAGDWGDACEGRDLLAWLDGGGA